MPSILLDVPLLSQGDSTDCLSTCVEMVVRYHGLHIRRSQLRQWLRSTDIGTPFSNVTFLREIGLVVEVKGNGTSGQVAQFLQQKQPMICAVNTSELPYWREPTQHAVVVVGLDQNRVFLNDPYYAQEHQSISLDDFMLAWIERDYQYALIRPR